MFLLINSGRVEQVNKLSKRLHVVEAFALCFFTLGPCRKREVSLSGSVLKSTLLNELGFIDQVIKEFTRVVLSELFFEPWQKNTKKIRFQIHKKSQKTVRARNYSKNSKGKRYDSNILKPHFLFNKTYKY